MRTALWIALALGALGGRGAGARAADAGKSGDSFRDFNAWPLWTVRDASSPDESDSYLGPLFFTNESANGRTSGGFRPFWVQSTDQTTHARETTVLYPLFSWREYADSHTWNVFKLIDRTAPDAPGGPPRDRSFDVWPFYFHRVPANPSRPASTGLLPIHGTVHDLLGFETVQWTLFPLYARSEKKGVSTTFVPFPFVRVESGKETGAALWPVYGLFGKPDGSRRQFALWPLFWDNRTPDSATTGLLPLWTWSRTPEAVSANWLWPFFGWTDRTAPYRYHETRYLWPFIVRGSGDSRTVNRWGPVYTHSEIKGDSSTWILWPLWHRDGWTAGGIEQTRTRLLWFLASDTEQRRAGDPNSPVAFRRHLWPLASAWDDGAGRRQIQLLSPFEPALADSPEAREAWQPLVSVYRYSRSADGSERTSLLWNAVTWERRSAEHSSEFHLGPVLAVRNGPDGRHWRLFGLDFDRDRRHAPALPAADTRTPTR